MNNFSENNNFLCIFNFRYNDEEFPLRILKMCEDIFKHFGYPIKKIYYANEKNSRSPKYERFKMMLSANDYNYTNISFYSGKKYSLDSDFYIDIRNYTRFAKFSPQCKDLFTVSIVIKEQRIIDNIINNYIDIVNILSHRDKNEFSGFAYSFSKKYDDSYLAYGILNGGYKYSYDMYNLANWINDSSLKSGTIGYLGVFTNLDEFQTSILRKTLGSENIYIVNNTVIYNCKNAVLNPYSGMNKEDSFFVTSEYSELSRLFEHLLSYESVGYNYYTNSLKSLQ